MMLGWTTPCRDEAEDAFEESLGCLDYFLFTKDRERWR